MTIRAIVGAVSIAVIATTNGAAALSLSSISARARELAGQARSLSGDPHSEKAMVEKLGELVLSYIDESDRLQRTGDDEQRGSELRAAFDAVNAPLSGIYRAHNDRLERLSREVMDRDGDLEALYETASFKSSQMVAANALYYLNWLSYYGARVHQGSRRKELLKACEKGFSEFAVGEHSRELVGESLLGRGLCYLELGIQEWARRDFKTVLEGAASGERKAKARMALLDSYFRGGNRTKVVAYANDLLNGGLAASEDAPVIRFYQLQALFALADGASGSRAEDYRRQAGAVMTELRRAGKGWGEKVDALLFSQVKDPSQWVSKADSPTAQWQLAQMLLQKEDCKGAKPLLDKIIAGKSGEAKRRRHEAHYWTGVCEFKAQRFDQANAALSAALAGAGSPSHAGEARYLRFKALESLMAVEDPPQELALRYVAALRELLEHHPDHAHGDEAHYRLGEYLQATGEFAEAIASYGRVTKDASYLVRSRFGTLQSRFELLRVATDSQQRDEIVRQIGSDLTDYDQRAAGYRGSDVPLQELNAKVTLLRAVHASLSEDVDHAATAALLEGYAKRFAGQSGLIPQAARMRLGALLKLGRFAEAVDEVQVSGQALVEEGRAAELRTLANAYAKSGRLSESPTDAAPAARVAVALFDLAGQAGGEEASLRQRVSIAQLQEKAGQLDAAAATYASVVAQNPNTLAALRGLARIAEAKDDPGKALEYWVTYTDKVRPGDTGWFRGQYEQSRLALAKGDKAATCERLGALRAAMPGLKDEEIREALKKLFSDAGC